MLSMKKIVGLEITETYFNYYVKENNEILKNYNTYPIKYIVGDKDKDLFQLRYHLNKFIHYSQLLVKRKKYLVKKMQYNSLSENKLEVVDQIADINTNTINMIIYLIDIINISLSYEINLDNINELPLIYEDDEDDEDEEEQFTKFIYPQAKLNYKKNNKSNEFHKNLLIINSLRHAYKNKI
jgi:hypothetical protein